MLKKYLEKVLNFQDLTRDESYDLMNILASQEASTFQSGAILCGLRMKGETAEELVGGASMLKQNGVFINTGTRSCVDIVGTGGDGGISFNISTTSAFVAAGAGVVIAKHGNRAVSGKSGAADMLAALGFNLEVTPDRIEDSIVDNGIGFMFAQKMHPVMSKVATMRRSLGVRTIFNLLGPLSNPAGAKSMVVGVYDEKLTELYAETLMKLGVKHAMVVHGNDGLDEITCCDTTRVCEVKDGQIKSYDLYPELLLGSIYNSDEIGGGTPEENAQICLDILSGKEQGAPRAIVVLNAAAACYVGGLCETYQDGIKLAEESIDSGKAMEKLNLLIEESK